MIKIKDATKTSVRKSPREAEEIEQPIKRVMTILASNPTTLDTFDFFFLLFC